MEMQNLHRCEVQHTGVWRHIESGKEITQAALSPRGLTSSYCKAVPCLGAAAVELCKALSAPSGSELRASPVCCAPLVGAAVLNLECFVPGLLILLSP